jgi:transcriptional regulator with XRE-family HTH domain
MKPREKGGFRVHKRIEEIRKSCNLSRAAFGDRIGVSGDVINNLERGRVEIKDHIIKLICMEFNVNEEWLKTGNGEMFLDMSLEEEIAKLTIDLLKEEDDSFKSRLISVLSRMTPEEWKWLEEKAREVVGTTKKE